MEQLKLGSKYKVIKLLNKEGKPIKDSPYIGREVTVVRPLDNPQPYYLCDDGKVYLKEELELLES